MTDIQTPAPEAGDEAISAPEIAEVETTSDETGQVETPPADGEKPEDEERKSRSKERRERQKQHVDQLRQSEAQARQEAQAAVNRIREMEQAAQSLPLPKQSDFADFESYQAALTSHYTLKAVDARQIERAKQEARAAYDAVQEVERRKQAARGSAIQLIIDEGSTAYPDFAAVALSDHVRITEAMAEVIAETDAPGDIAYYLGKTPAMAAQLADMTVVQMARAIGKIEAQISASRKTVSTAPPPIAPVKPRATASVNVESMTMEEYKAARKAGKLK